MTQDILEVFKGLGLEDESTREKFRRLAELAKPIVTQGEPAPESYIGSTTAETKQKDDKLESTR